MKRVWPNICFAKCTSFFSAKRTCFPRPNGPEADAFCAKRICSMTDLVGNISFEASACWGGFALLSLVIKFDTCPEFIFANCICSQCCQMHDFTQNAFASRGVSKCILRKTHLLPWTQCPLKQMLPWAQWARAHARSRSSLGPRLRQVKVLPRPRPRSRDRAATAATATATATAIGVMGAAQAHN